MRAGNKIVGHRPRRAGSVRQCRL